MQEEYGIKLRILTESLQSSVNKAKGIVSNFTTKIKADFQEARQPIDLNINNDKFQKQINYIEYKINELKNKLRGKPMEVGDILKTKSDIEKLTNQLNVLKNKTKEVGDEAEDTKSKLSGISINATMTNKTIVNGFKNSWNSIKKFAFSLLSLRGIYGLIRKASSAYMSQDKSLADQMQRTWASVGAMMAPIIETIVKWIRIGAAYLNYFIKALTGKDLIGKAVKKINKYNKSLGGTAKAAKSVNKELTTLDEVTNLSFDNTTDIEDAAQAFDDFGDIKLDKKVTDMLDTLAKKVKEVGKFLKPIIDWAVEHPGAVLTILGGAGLLTLLTKLTGNGVGSLGALAKIGVVVAGVDLIYNAVTGRDLMNDLKDIIVGLNDLKNSLKDNEEQTKSNLETGEEQNKKYKEMIDNQKKGSEVITRVNKNLQKQNEIETDNINNINQQITKFPKWNKNYKTRLEQIKNLTKAEKLNTDAMYYGWEQEKLNDKQTQDLAGSINDQIHEYENLLETTDKNSELAQVYKGRIKDLQIQLLNMTGKDYNARVGVDTNEAERKTDNIVDKLTNKIKNKVYTAKADVDNKIGKDKIDTMADGLKKLTLKPFTAIFKVDVGTKDAKERIKNFFTSTNNLFKKGSALGGVVKAMNNGVLQALLNAIPAYDVGTNYVPNDQLAMVHKGEAIVPKKFNNEQFFNQNNEETNALLVEVNQNLIELRNRPNVLEVNGRELAQATYSDFQNEGSRLNQSMTIKRSGN